MHLKNQFLDQFDEIRTHQEEPWFLLQDLPNEDEHPQYHVENNHEVIIKREVFDLPQVELDKLEKRQTVNIFTGSLFCQLVDQLLEAMSSIRENINAPSLM